MRLTHRGIREVPATELQHQARPLVRGQRAKTDGGRPAHWRALTLAENAARSCSPERPATPTRPRPGTGTPCQRQAPQQ
jgi:hypothetical protein